VQRLVELGIPVMGHLGLTPQSVNQLGGTRVQGKRADAARRLIEDAIALENAGAFALVLELVPDQLAQEITERLHVPTIGIGAGAHCDGQVLVWHDLLGLYTDFVPRHTRRYASLADTISSALQQFAAEVHAGEFPAQEHGSVMEDGELQRALRELVEQH
jgi:3-methyl-2-oxobutanoate hydroxymethyltransferase